MQQQTQRKQQPDPPGAPVAAPRTPGLLPPLDELETKSHGQDASLRVINTEELDQPVSFRHGGWASDRARVRAALVEVGVGQNRTDSWDNCGSHPWLVRSTTNPDLYAIHADYCHDRFCKPCAAARSAIIAGNLADKIAKRKHRLITLTVRSAQEPLETLVDHLYDSFAKLRRTRLWRWRVRGGACFLEVKYNKQLQRWHPHLHIIVEAQFIKAGELSDHWKMITKSSYITDIRLIRSSEEAANYVAKYASKPLSQSYLRDHQRLCEAIVALTGRRLCLTFGVWRRWKLLDAPKNGPWIYIGSLTSVVEEAKKGSKHHLYLLQSVGLTVVFDAQQRPAKDRGPPAEHYLFNF